MEIVDHDFNYSLKRNLDREFSSNKELGHFSEIFTWNYYGIAEFYNLIENKKWIIPIIHGYIEQKSILKLPFILTY